MQDIIFLLSSLQGCTAIVMLTNVVERGMTKCASYFPAKPGESTNSLGIEVKCLEAVKQGELTVRKLQVWT